jgi:hypothetical protein
MAKKKEEITNEGLQRLSRKDVLIARKQAEQMRRIKLGIYIVLGLLGLLVIVAVVNEVFIAPNRPVAIVGDTNISLREWQERVKFERAQRIILLENQLEAFQNDVGIVQQFGGQVINELLQPELLGQTVLNNMIDEAVVVQAAQERGITVTDEEVDAEIGATFNYFGGESPTPFPTATATIAPTPSVTPIPTPVITDVIPTSTPFPTPTLGPTNTPAPTATPVSAAAYQQELDEFIAQFTAYDISEEQYRELVRVQLYQEKLMDALAEERELPAQGEHASFYILQFDTEAEANEALAKIAADGYLQVWNEVRSLTLDPNGVAATSGTAGETIWRTEDVVVSQYGDAVAQVAFNLDIGAISEVLVNEIDAETSTYAIIQVTGREMRDLSAAQISQNKQQELITFIDEELAGNLTLTEYDQGRVPTTPVLDPKFTAAPTATPETP